MRNPKFPVTPQWNFRSGAGLLLFLTVFSCGQTAEKTPSADEPLNPKRIIIKTGTQPAPAASPLVRNPPAIIAQSEGVRLRLPHRFEARLFAESDFGYPRTINEYNPDGSSHHLFVSGLRTPPDVPVESHAAALGIAFVRGKMFPPKYQGDAFVALHKSWNRTKPSGYKIIRNPFKDGKPKVVMKISSPAGYPMKRSQRLRGHPVGVWARRDGSLPLMDDDKRQIWRVTYQTEENR